MKYVTLLNPCRFGDFTISSGQCFLAAPCIFWRFLFLALTLKGHFQSWESSSERSALRSLTATLQSMLACFTISFKHKVVIRTNTGVLCSSISLVRICFCAFKPSRKKICLVCFDLQFSEYRRIGDLREINFDKRQTSVKNINSDKHPPIFKKNKHRKHGALQDIHSEHKHTFTPHISRWTIQATPMVKITKANPNPHFHFLYTHTQTRIPFAASQTCAFRVMLTGNYALHTHTHAHARAPFIHNIGLSTRIVLHEHNTNTHHICGFADVAFWFDPCCCVRFRNAGGSR